MNALMRVAVAGVRLADEVDVLFADQLDLFGDAVAEVGQPHLLDVLDGVESEAVKVVVFHPPQGVIDGEVARRAVVEVEVGQVVAEPARRRFAAFPRTVRRAADALPSTTEVERVEPALVHGVDGRVLVDMVHGVVNEDLDAALVGLGDDGFELGLGAEAALGLRQIARPVAVVAGVVATVVADADSIGVVHRYGQPQRVDAERLEVAVLELLQKAGPVAPLPIHRGIDTAAGVRDVVGGVAVEEAIHEHEVHHRVAPVEAAGSG
jgi:hypothetical protein